MEKYYILLSALIIVLCILSIRAIRKLVLRNNHQAGNQPKTILPVTERTKYPEVNVLHHTGMRLKIGFIFSLLLVFFAINWTTTSEGGENLHSVGDFITELEVVPPTSGVKREEIPLPRPDDIINTVEDKAVETEVVPEIETTILPEIEKGEDHDVRGEAIPYRPPLPEGEPTVDRDEIFSVAEQMPRFPGCEHLTGTDEEKRMCAEKKMLEFIYTHIRYPQIARGNQIEGVVIVSFIINRRGELVDPEIIRDIGGNCGRETLRVVNLMNELPERWTPGRQGGRDVSVRFNLPVRFVLE